MKLNTGERVILSRMRNVEITQRRGFMLAVSVQSNTELSDSVLLSDTTLTALFIEQPLH